VRVAVAMAASDLDAARRDFMADLAPYLGLLALALIVAGWAQLSVGLSPLRDLGARIAALRTGRAERMGHDWPVELRPVAAEIDDLLAERDVETGRARARAADLAHGLKTPLQALMGEAARLRRDGAPRGPRGSRTPPAPCAAPWTASFSAPAPPPAQRMQAPIPPLSPSAWSRSCGARPDGAKLQWRQAIPPGLSVALDEADLAEAMGALAENAARHAKGEVVLSADRDGARASDRHRR
jgi:hypothetical protein